MLFELFSTRMQKGFFNGLTSDFCGMRPSTDKAQSL